MGTYSTISMKTLVICSLFVAVSWAMPQGYNAPSNDITCGEGEVLNVDGSCSRPVVTRNIFVYAAPEQPRPLPGPVEVPPPKVDYNIVFVRAPEGNAAQDPIIVPPPQQRTLVYVLSKKPEDGGQRVIEVPAGPASNPEVYFVNYGPGESPQLPGGVNLQTALGAAAAPGGAGPFRDAAIAGPDAGLGGANGAFGVVNPGFGGANPGFGGANPGFGGGTPGFILEGFNQGGLQRQGDLGAPSGLGGAPDLGALDLGATGAPATLGGAGGVPLPNGGQFQA